MSVITPLDFDQDDFKVTEELISRIKSAAKNCGYSQRDLSIRSGLTQATISNIFSRGSGSINALIRLSKAVHYDLVLDLK